MSRPSVALSLARLRRSGGEGGPTFEEASARLAECSDLLPILLLAALGMMPSPGLPLGLICGVLVAWLALSSLWPRRRRRPLPARFASRRVPRGLLDGALRFLVPLLRKVERRARFRLPALASGPGERAARLAIALQGVLLALPLPLANPPPAAAILALAAGLMWRDGLGVLAGHVLSLASLALVGGLAWGAWALVA